MKLPATIREKLAQLLFVRVGSNMPPICGVEQDSPRIKQLLRTCPVGGLILFNGSWDRTPSALEELQSISSTPLLVAADIERGVGQQLRGYPLFPHARAFSALGPEAENCVREFACLTSIAAKAAGIHITLAPVADVNLHPKNPIISTRSYGTEVQQVAKLVAAFVDGCRKGGLLTAAKHFPGHGSTHEDSHHVLPSVSLSWKEMLQKELPAFQAAIDAGVSLVMSAHVRYPAIDPSGACATLSRPILVNLLRDELGFQGAVISDSMEMAAVKSQSPDDPDPAVRAINAGVDILADVGAPEAILAELEQAVEQGVLSEERVEQAFQRVWKLKEIAFGDSRPFATEQVTEATCLKDTEKLIARVATKSISTVSQGKVSLPLSKDVPLCCVFLTSHQQEEGQSQRPLESELRLHFPAVNFVEVGPETDANSYKLAEELAQEAEQILVAIVVKPSAWHHYGLRQEQAELISRLLAHENAVLASLGAAEALDDFDAVITKVCVYSDVPASQRALAQFVAGDA